MPLTTLLLTPPPTLLLPPPPVTHLVQGTCIDYYEKIEREKELVLLRRQRKRIFQRLSSGMYYWKSDALRFLTLTSAPDSGDIWRAWKSFVQQVRRKYGQFAYFMIQTNEGNGVIHCVFKGKYIPFEWIQDKWRRYHGAFHVNIKKVGKVYSPSGLAGYFLSQYIQRQNAIVRYQMSRDWLPPGNIKIWTIVKRKYRKRGMEVILESWHEWLDSNHQTKLKRFKKR